MRRLWLIVALAVALALVLALTGAWRLLVAPLALLTAGIGAALRAAGADTQRARPGHPRRGGLGGSPSEGGGSAETAASPTASGGEADPARDNRPHRPGF